MTTPPPIPAPSDKMIERVAHALYPDKWPDWSWSAYSPDRHARYRAQARAAYSAVLASLREEGMVVVDERDMKPSGSYFRQQAMFRTEPTMYGWMEALEAARAKEAAAHQTHGDQE